MSRTALLILRPEPGASMTAKRAFDEGWRPVVSPIFRIEPIAWAQPPAADYDALMVTSANAVRQAGKAIRAYAEIPAYAVGDATARALKAAGFSDIRTGRGDAAIMIEAAAENGVKSALHLAGEDYRDVGHEAIAIDRRIVYRSASLDGFGDKAVAALRESGSVVLLHSGRAAEHFIHLLEATRIPRGRIRIAALAPAILTAAGPGWRRSIAAAKPDDAALLAAAARLCQ